MCDNFFDIRAFGAVMTTDVNCGQVRGPIQFGLARSIHPIVSSEHAVTRCAVTTPAEAEKQEGGNRTMGRKFTVPYGLYRVHGYVNPNLAGGTNGTGFSEDDLGLLKRALDQMFESDRSAARANMRPVACVAFRHESPLGNARADRLFSRVRCRPRPGVQPLPGEADGNGEGRPPRSFGDYELTIDEENCRRGSRSNAGSTGAEAMYHESDFLPISAPPALLYCERQCALIHVERLWAENRFTAEGKFCTGRPTPGDRTAARGRARCGRCPCTVSSSASSASPTSSLRRGRGARPVEYKRGRPKRNDCDRVQLCAQALCLEEMLGVSIDRASSFTARPAGAPSSSSTRLLAT